MRGVQGDIDKDTKQTVQWKHWNQQTQAMLSGRDADLAQRLREAAASGSTSLVIKLLESGAPFIVDSVSESWFITVLSVMARIMVYGSIESNLCFVVDHLVLLKNIHSIFGFIVRQSLARTLYESVK